MCSRLWTAALKKKKKKPQSEWLARNLRKVCMFILMSASLSLSTANDGVSRRLRPIHFCHVSVTPACDCPQICFLNRFHITLSLVLKIFDRERCYIHPVVSKSTIPSNHCLWNPIETILRKFLILYQCIIHADRDKDIYNRSSRLSTLLHRRYRDPPLGD